MATTKPTFGQKELRVLGVTIIFFIIMAGSAIGFALTRNTLFLYPMTAFGIMALIFLAWYFTLSVKSAKEAKITKDIKKEKPKEATEPLGGTKA